MGHHRLVALLRKQGCQHLRIGVAFHVDVEVALRERDGDALLAEALENGDPQGVLHGKPIREVCEMEAQFEIQRKVAETEEFHMRLGIAQYRRLGAHQLKQNVHDPLRIGIIGNGDRDFSAHDAVAVRPVTNGGIDEFGIRHDDRLAAEGLDFRGAHRKPLDRALGRAGHHPVANLEGALHQQDEAGDEVRHDILQAETDTDRKGGSDQRQTGEVEAGGRHAEDGRNRNAEISDACFDGVAHAGIHLAARHDVAVQPLLEPAGDDVTDGEDENAAENADQRDRGIADGDTRQQAIGPAFCIAGLSGTGPRP